MIYALLCISVFDRLPHDARFCCLFESALTVLTVELAINLLITIARDFIFYLMSIMSVFNDDVLHSLL